MHNKAEREGKGGEGRSKGDLLPKRQTDRQTVSIPDTVLGLGFWKIPSHSSKKSLFLLKSI